MTPNEDSLFDKAMAQYQSGISAKELIKDFEKISSLSPNNSAAWTCLAWLQLLCDLPEDALKSAKIAVKLNGQDPQARINLSLALLETSSKGVRDHIDFVKRAMIILPDIEKELRESIEDGLSRRPDWPAIKKIKSWLEFY